MKIRVDSGELAEGVGWAARALPTRPTIPTLAGIKLDATNSLLRFSGFNLESSSSCEVEADVDEPGTLLVSGRLLADISRSLPSSLVTIATDGQRAELSCGRSVFMLPTLPVEEYPALPDMPDPIGAVSGSLFGVAVTSVAVAAGRDDTLPMLQGIRIEIRGDQVVLAATDRYRLAVREFKWRSVDVDFDGAALVPARVLAETAKQLASADLVTVAHATSASMVGDGLIGFSGDGRCTITRLIDGEFPKYRQLFPEHSVAIAKVNASVLADAVKRVALVAERHASVKLRFGNEMVELHAGSGDDANADESVECALTGDELEIAFNPQYLLDGLGAVGSTMVDLAFTGPTKPAVLSPPTAAGSPSYRYLLMPVRI